MPGGVHPLFRQVDGAVRSELNRRAKFYGSRVRSPGASISRDPIQSYSVSQSIYTPVPITASLDTYTPGSDRRFGAGGTSGTGGVGGQRGSTKLRPSGTKSVSVNTDEASIIAFSYGKTAWARVDGSIGFASNTNSRVISDTQGNLKLYEPSQNKPRNALLQSVEVTTEGTMGSLMKAKFTATYYPPLSRGGFSMGPLARFIIPGEEVSIEWGWSVDNYGPNNGFFSGIVNNFDWSVNNDLSVTVNVSLVSKGTLAVGTSGEVTNPDASGTTPTTGDPAQTTVVSDGDLAGIVDKDIKTLTGTSGTSATPLTLAQVGEMEKVDIGTTASKKFNYYKIVLPMSQADLAGVQPFGTGGASGTGGVGGAQGTGGLPPVVQPMYYVSLGDLCALIDKLASGTDSGSDLYKVFCQGNKTEEIDFPSAAPEEVFFPSQGKMGTYGEMKLKSLPIDIGSGCIDIGNILISTTAIIRVYRDFVKDNQTKLEEKNITGLFNELIKLVNYASGEMYQLTTIVTDETSGKGKASITIEDSNVSRRCFQISPFTFDASIAKPLLKTVSITSKPPNLAATAAFVSNRGGKKTQSDVRFTGTPNESGGIDGAPTDGSEVTEATQQINQLLTNFAQNGGGAGNTFSTAMKGNLARVKRNENGHWTDRIIYPIDLSLTIDGIDGFKHGDLIDTTLIPASHTALEFVVTKVTQTIKDGVWETTLQAKSRLP